MMNKFFRTLLPGLNENNSEPLDNVEGRYYSSKNPELYFRDGKRIIDYVLVYKKSDKIPEKLKKRNSFLAVLASKKIEIEVEDADGNIIAGTGTPDTIKINPKYKNFSGKNDDESTTPEQRSMVGFESVQAAVERSAHTRDLENGNDLVFVKLHASWNLMLTYADILKFRKPLKKDLLNTRRSKSKKKDQVIESDDEAEEARDENLEKELIMAEYTRSGKSSSGLISLFKIKPDVVKPISFPFTVPFQKSKIHLFDIDQSEKDSFFTQTERSYVVNYILRRAGTKSDSSEPQNGPHKTKPKSSIDQLERASSQDARNLLEPQDVEYERNTGVRPVDRYLATADEEEDIDYGIAKLLNDGLFHAAFPLHEPKAKNRTQRGPDQMNVRMMLVEQWASWKKAHKEQPIDYIRLYFGEMVGFYFAWLGFYTMWLVIPTIVGIIVFFSGFFGLINDPIVRDVCTDLGDTVMCPICLNCQTTTLNKSCMRARFSRILDNTGIVVFAIFMALWATIFIEMWKRQEFRLAYRWNVHEMVQVEEPPRPEFIALVGKRFNAKKDSFNSGNPEPHIPMWSNRVPMAMFTVTIILLSMLLSIAILFGVIVFKIYFAYRLRSQSNEFLRQIASMLATVVGALLSLISITLLTQIFNRVAYFLNDREHHRTQTQYDDALTLKLYLLQFVNIYSSIVYVAFIQGPSAGLPGEPSNSIITQFGCDAGDCLFELFLQMVVIMVGKQIFGFAMENLMPVLIRMYQKFKLFGSAIANQHHHHSMEEGLSENLDSTDCPMNSISDQDLKRAVITIDMCKEDTILSDPGSCPLFSEYLEMMLQFGFITIFVAAFPLAPFFALLNNIFEIRGDAKKFLNAYRRPVASRSKDIGIWADILSVLASIAVRSNALVIAFTTQFIQRLVYQLNYRAPGAHGFDNYVNFSLSTMSCDRFNGLDPDCSTCSYPDFREPPTSPNAYQYTKVYWNILAAKFIFIFAFENVVIALTSILAYLVPDVPGTLAILMRREASLTGEIILRAEKGGGAMKDIFGKLSKTLEPPKEQEKVDYFFYDFSSGEPRVIKSLEAKRGKKSWFWRALCFKKYARDIEKCDQVNYFV